MDNDKRDRFLHSDELIPVLKALAEPNRLRIFAELMRGNSCNGELQEKLEMPANLLSHHLRALAKAGLVKSRRDRIDGRWIYYTINSETISYWHRWLNTFLDPERINERPVCGPEGRQISQFLPVSSIADPGTSEVPTLSLEQPYH